MYMFTFNIKKLICWFTQTYGCEAWMLKYYDSLLLSITLFTENILSKIICGTILNSSEKHIMFTDYLKDVQPIFGVIITFVTQNDQT